jgi:hypothetical protein
MVWARKLKFYLLLLHKISLLRNEIVLPNRPSAPLSSVTIETRRITMDVVSKGRRIARSLDLIVRGVDVSTRNHNS